MSAIGKPLQIRLFLEGIEIPVVAAQVSMGLNAPAAASIQVIPTDTALALMPRTMVHLFYLDNSITQAQSTSGEVANEVSRTMRSYKLLFSGEVVAYQFQQTPQSRGLVLQCIDFSSYWDSAHATAIEFGPGGNWATHTGAVSGSNTAVFDDLVNTQKERLMGWVKDKPHTPGLQTISGLAGGIIRVMEGVSGVPGAEAGVNDFFTVAELRCKLLQQITAEENDNTASQLFSTQIFDEWIRNGLQNIGQKVTFRDIIKLLFQYIYYEMSPNPVAMFVPAGTQGHIDVKKAVIPAVAKTKEGAAALSILKAQAVSVQNAITRSPPANQWRAFFLGIRTKIEEAQASLKKIKTKSLNLSDVVGHVDYALSEARSLLDQTDGKWDAAKDLVTLLRDAANLITNGSGSSSEKITSTMKTDRLHTQIFRPDCWFSPPPVCNVIFPEHYASLQFERNFVGEVSRVLVQAYNTLVGPDALLTDRILAPSITAKDKELVKYVGTHSYRILMDHELHTGIVPREEWLPNTAFTSKEKEESAREKTAGLRVQWIKRVALFNFFKYRFGSRSAAAAGRFNPNLVCGFPAVVIRGPYYPKTDASEAGGQLTTQYVLDNARSLGAPVHLVGMIGSLSHNIDQQGGVTTFQMHHVRYHSGTDDRYLSTVKGEQKVTRQINIKLSYDALSASTDKSTSKKLIEYLCGLTPKSVSKAAPQTVSRVSASGGSTAQATVTSSPPPAGTTWAGAGDGRYLTPIGARIGEAGPLKHGKVLRIVVTDPTIVKDGNRNAFREVIVTVNEDIAVDTEIPTEEILRPRSWFSVKYANDLIGSEIYQQFFGCDSIIDELRLVLGDEVIDDPTTVSIADPVGDVSGQDLVSYVDDIKTRTQKLYSHSIERAIDLIAYTYGRVRRETKDVEDFIQQFTYRPVATQMDILGDPNLSFDVAANGKATPRTVDLGDGLVGTPQVGFHTAAIHPDLVNSPVKLAGLVEDITLQLPRVGGTGKAKVIANYDVRQEKRNAVLAYFNELTASRAFRG